MVCIEAVSAAVNSPVTSSAPPCMWCTRCMQRHAVAQLATGASCINARPTPVGMAAASGSPTAALLAAIAWQGQQDFAATAAPIGVCRGRECGSQQPSHLISSSLHVVHAAHGNRRISAQPAGAARGAWQSAHISSPLVLLVQLLAAAHKDRGHRLRCQSTAQQQVVVAQVSAATADWRVSRP